VAAITIRRTKLSIQKMRGGRTRTRTLDPLIKSYGAHNSFGFI
jgi:hypothetical protein